MVVPDFSKPPRFESMREPPWRPRKRWRIVWDSLSAIRDNPRGMIANLRVGPRLHLFDKPGILYRDSSASLLFATDLTPAYHRVGAALVLMPLTILEMWIRYDRMVSHGLFNYSQSYRTPLVDVSDTAVEKRAHETYVAAGSMLSLGARTLAKVGPVVARVGFEAFRASLDLRPGDTVFYDGFIDMPFPNDGWASRTDADLIYMHQSGFKLAVRYTMNHAFFRDEHFAVGPKDASRVTPNHRIGPAFLYTFAEGENDGGVSRDPTLALLVQWWLRHPHRTGQDVSQSYPYLLLVFLQQGDLL